MSQIRPGIPLANHTTAVGIDVSPVILIFSMLDDDVTVPREEPAVARMASRHDAIEHIEMVLAAIRPDERAVHGFLGFKLACRISQTIIEDHHDVGTKRRLHIYSDFRTQKVRAAVEVRLEFNAVVSDVAQ